MRASSSLHQEIDFDSVWKIDRSLLLVSRPPVTPTPAAAAHVTLFLSEEALRGARDKRDCFRRMAAHSVPFLEAGERVREDRGSN